MIYLASPYTHKDPHVVEWRYRENIYRTRGLMKVGVEVFSPVVYFHEIAKRNMPKEHEFWMQRCFAMLDLCTQMYVLPLIGWDISKGVALEIERCNETNKPWELYL
jgi:hypothetical protein